MDDQRAPLPFVASSIGLGAIVAAALIYQRLTHGNGAAASLFLALLLGVTAGTAQVTRILLAGRDMMAAFATQAFSMGAVIVGVHAIFAVVLMLAHDDPTLAGLHETPRQLVNDIVFASCLLLMAWSFVAAGFIRRFGAALGAITLVVFYALTAESWHVDSIEFTRVTTQHFVCAQVAGVSMGLLGFHWLQGGMGGGSSLPD